MITDSVLSKRKAYELLHLLQHAGQSFSVHSLPGRLLAFGRSYSTARPLYRGTNWSNRSVIARDPVVVCLVRRNRIETAISGDPALRRLEEQAEVALEVFRETYFSGIPSHCEVQSGAVAETITDRAVNWGVDLIMMPTRGLGRSRPFLIGSTTAKVLHDASCAVWTSPHLRSATPKPYMNVLCTVDREEIPRGYLQEATRLATCFGSKISFVTAVPSYVGGAGDEHSLRHLTTEFPQAEVNQCSDPPNCSIITETGPVGDVIRKVAQSHSADLVITNRGHLHQDSGRFVSHVYEIVLESPCPVLSLCIHAQNHPRQSLDVMRPQVVGL